VSFQLIFVQQNIILFLRILVSVFFGLIALETFEYIFSIFDEKQIDKGIFLGYLIIFLFSVYEISKGIYRIKSTFTEPAHLGEYIVFIYLPWFLLRKENIKKANKIFILSSLLLITLLTFSTTTYIRLILFFSSYMLFSVSLKNKIKILILTSLSIAIITFVVFSTENYAKGMINYSLTATSLEEQSVSFVDRFSFWIMMARLGKYVTNVNTFNILFGSGLGNESNLKYYLQSSIYEKILTAKGTTASKIPNLWGKIYVYGGFIGLLIYLLFYFSLFKDIKKTTIDPYKKSILYSITLSLFLYQSIGNGYFHSLTNWFFLAYIFSKSSILNYGGQKNVQK
jgi:hypothetical protein